ncbi:hypothetical protein [Deinococcus psychrotolerans]|uniref:hypothetical protein n=1 Tax=Deinococcus psychrotolerans TaxID=2489213 RepID=UPI001F15474D|nr:hypothetical protein [Deinococcus psychrotolerans]
MTNNPQPEGEGKDAKRRAAPRRNVPEQPLTEKTPQPEAESGDSSLAGLLDGLILPEDLLVEGRESSAKSSVDTDGKTELHLSVSPQAQVGSASTMMVTALTPMFPGTTPFLARFLPAVTPSHTGIQTGFCNLHDFLRFLHDQNWYGFLHAGLGEQAAYVLVYEGRTVAAAGLSSTGEQALGELLHLYDQGAPLSAYPLDQRLAHILSGVGSRAWKFNLTDDFTGLHSRPGEAVFYDQGQVVATLPAGLSYEGAFPAPLRPQTLILPRSLAGWAHHGYVATLRGRDAVNAITAAYQSFRARYGQDGLSFQKALVDGLTPAEYALRRDVALHDLEALLKELIGAGYLKED